MKKNQKQIGLQILSDFYGLNVTANPTLAFLSIVCCCMSKEEVKEFFGLSNWEYNRIKSFISNLVFLATPAGITPPEPYTWRLGHSLLRFIDVSNVLPHQLTDNVKILF